MSFEKSLQKSQEGESAQPEAPADEAAERQVEQEVVEPVDIVELGKIEMSRGENGPISADHTFIKVNRENWQQFGSEGLRATNGEVELNGKVRNKETGIEEDYAYEYSKLPDGRVIPSKLESKFSDGKSETVERVFDEKGRVAKDIDMVNGELAVEVLYVYDEKEKPSHVTVRRYEKGKIVEEGQYKSHGNTGGRLSITGHGQGRALTLPGGFGAK